MCSTAMTPILSTQPFWCRAVKVGRRDGCNLRREGGIKDECTTATHLPGMSCCKRCEQSHHTLSSSVQDRQRCQAGLPASAYAPYYDMSSSAARIRGPDETAVRWLIRTQVSGLLTGFLPYRL